LIFFRLFSPTVSSFLLNAQTKPRREKAQLTREEKRKQWGKTDGKISKSQTTQRGRRKGDKKGVQKKEREGESK
jgi:hypothetical protein